MKAAAPADAAVVRVVWLTLALTVVARAAAPLTLALTVVARVAPEAAPLMSVQAV